MGARPGVTLSRERVVQEARLGGPTRTVGLWSRRIDDVSGLTSMADDLLRRSPRCKGKESDVSAKRSGAAMYPAFECSRCGRWP
jgi:hypothetical protein